MSLAERSVMESRGRTPLVSVIMPTYNAEKTLEASILSVLSQTLRDWELIVVLNGITDSSIRISRTLAANDVRVRLIELREASIIAALQSAVGAARGRFVAVLDADDVARSDRLATQVEFLASHPDVGLVGSWVRRIDMEGRLLGVARMPTRQQGLTQLLRHQCLMYHSTVMVRRECLDQIGGYSVGFACAPDFDLYLKLLDADITIDNIPIPLVDYRVVPTGITQSRGTDQRQYAEIAVARSRLRGLGVDPPSLGVLDTALDDLKPLIPAGALPGLRLRLNGFDDSSIVSLGREDLEAAHRRALGSFAPDQKDSDLSLLAYRLAVAFRRQGRLARAAAWYRRSHRADPLLFRVLLARTIRAAVVALRER
jgi:hypothetical protein